MRIISIHSAKAGDRLGRSIRNEDGDVLLAAGQVLNQQLIQRLASHNIQMITIQDHLTEDIHVQDVINEETRNLAYLTIRNTFEAFGENGLPINAVFTKEVSLAFRNIFEMIYQELTAKGPVMAMLDQVFAVDEPLFCHSLNVAIYTLALAIAMKLNKHQCFEIGMGALLHDIGKMKIPRKILDKPGKLTHEEFEEIKRHTEYGFDILRRAEDIPLLSAHCAFQHHERLNGTGYPRQLSGGEIHLYGKIMAVADVFDAMTTNRVYRQGHLPNDALEHLFAGANILYDQKVVDLFRDTISLYPVGATVRLSTGESGVVVKNNRMYPQRPVIRIFSDQADQPLRSPYELDLSKHMSVTIIAMEIDRR